MTDYLQDFEVFGVAVLPLILGTVAALVRQAQYGWRGVGRFIRELVICCFMSVIIFWGLDYFALQPTVKCAISTGCSFASMTLIEALTAKITRVIRDYRVPGVEEKPEKTEGD